MTLLDQVLAANDRKVRALNVPEWGLDIYIRDLSSKQRQHLKSLWMPLVRGKGDLTGLPPDLEPITVIYGVCDEAGAPVFTMEHLPALREKNGAVIGRIAEAINKLSGIDPDAVEEAEKN